MRLSLVLGSKRLKLERSILTTNVSELSHWELLPIEMKYEVFNAMTAEDLANFTLTSKTSMNTVFDYLNTPAGTNKFEQEVLLTKTPSTFGNWYLSCHTDYAVYIGKLLKNVTTHQSVKERLTFVNNIFLKVNLDIFAIATYCISPTSDWLLNFVGSVLQDFTRGWSKKDLVIFHKVLKQFTSIDKLMYDVLVSSPGTKPSKERGLRQYYHSLYIDYVPEARKGHMLSQVLHELPYVYQAKMLYILFGPYSNSSTVDWYAAVELTDSYLPYDIKCFAMGTMYLTQDNLYTDDQLLTIIQEVIVLPDMWHPLNTANYLMSCGKPVLKNYMSNILSNGRYSELSLFTLQCASMNLRLGKPVDQVLQDLMDTVMSREQAILDMKQFITFFPNFLSDVSRFGRRGRFFGIDDLCLPRTIADVSTAIAKIIVQICSNCNKMHCRD